MSQSPNTQPTKQGLKSWWKQFSSAQKASPKENVSLARAVFGVPLRESLRCASVQISAANPSGELYVWGYIPVVIAKCGLFLKENATEVEGIFQIFGSSENIRSLQTEFETPPRYGKDLIWKNVHYTPYDVASVFRRYITLLPEPIIPIDLYHQFRGALAVKPRDEANVIDSYRRLFKNMPRANQYILFYILDILSVFARKSDANLATESSLASILHPGIISHPSRKMQLEEHAINQEILVFLIQYQDHFMVEPPGRQDPIMLSSSAGLSNTMEYTIPSDEESPKGESKPVERGRILDNLDLRDQPIEGQKPLVAGSSNTSKSMKTDVDPPGALPDTKSGHPIVISHYMPTSEVVAHLGNHGCRDLTKQLDLSSGSTFPVSNGGFGDVWKARMQDSTHIAIKTMRPQINTADTGKKQLKHVARELHTWAKCDHPNVLKLLGLAMFRDQLGMVSLWMNNGSLPEYLSRKPESDRCKICIQICEGLVYLHQNDIIHGDLKGLNVLVSDDGSPVLTDFGNAKMRDRSLLFTTTTAHSSISTRWTAPELLDGPAAHSMEADIYALGMTILETLTGRVPYSDKGDAGVMFAVMIKKEPPKRPEDVIPNDSKDGDTLWSLLLSCWIHDPTSRPTAHQVAKVVKTIPSHGLISIGKTRVNPAQKLNR